MKLDKFRKNIGIPLRLWPVPKMGNRFVPDQRNQWMIVSEEDKGFNLENLVTDHKFLLTHDTSREYREPQIIILRAQVVLTEGGGVELIPFADAPNHELIGLPGGTFEGPLAIGLSAPDYEKELKLPVTNLENLPSDKAADEIRCILEKRGLLPNFSDYAWTAGALISSPLAPAPYEARSTSTLKENLSKVEEDFREHDTYELFELRGHKVNVHLMNGGGEYIEDASIQLRIEKCQGLLIAERIHEKPPESSSFVNVRFPHLSNDGYPRIEEDSDGYSIFEEIRNIKHGLATCAFDEPLRVVFTQQAKGQRIKIQCSIVGKNLRSPRTEELAIIVV